MVTCLYFASCLETCANIQDEFHGRMKRDRVKKNGTGTDIYNTLQALKETKKTSFVACSNALN
jgi:hypothetical protein